jgi:hypothetical protein
MARVGPPVNGIKSRLPLPAVVMSLLVERPTCVACIAVKAGVMELQAVRCIERIQETIHINVENAHADGGCGGCGTTVGPVYALAQSD